MKLQTIIALIVYVIVVVLVRLLTGWPVWVLVALSCALVGLVFGIIIVVLLLSGVSSDNDDDDPLSLC